MTIFTPYNATAGFPDVHIEAFKQVSRANRMVISSRGLNPLCTDLLLEGYAAKGYHIKAKTCDWGPMAGFVPTDHRFTKASQSIEQQRTAVRDALAAGAQSTPLVVSTARLKTLRAYGMFAVTSDDGQLMTISASAGPGQARHDFVLVRQRTAHWAICHARPAAAGTARTAGLYSGVETAGLDPVQGLANPARSAATGFKSAVCGDYDLWCVFPHASLKSPGINERQVALRAKLAGPAGQRPDGLVAARARQAGIVFPSEMDPVAAARLLGDAHLGNVSHAILRIRRQLNDACGAPGGNVVMHAEYGGFAFGAIDYPIILFIPRPDTGFQQVDHEVAISLATLKPLLKRIESMGYRVEPNPAWSLPNMEIVRTHSPSAAARHLSGTPRVARTANGQTWHPATAGA